MRKLSVERDGDFYRLEFDNGWSKVPQHVVWNLLGRDLEPGECVGPLWVCDGEDLAVHGTKSSVTAALESEGIDVQPTVKRVLAAAGKAIARQDDGWIPVEDGLPDVEKVTWFHVTTKDHNGDCSFDWVYYVPEGSGTLSLNGNLLAAGWYWGDDSKAEGIVAYQLLPEPYQPSYK